MIIWSSKRAIMFFYPIASHLKAILLLGSVVTYILAYQYVTLLWWLIGVAYVLLSCYYMHARISSKHIFYHGMQWGICIYAFHLYPLFMLSYAYARALGLLFLVGLCIYMALTTAVWFVVTDKILKRYRALWYRFCILIISMYSYIYFIDNCSFFIFDICEGYGAVHPLVPCMQVALCRKIVWLLGAEWATLFFVTACNGIAVFGYRAFERASYLLSIVSLFGMLLVIRLYTLTPQEDPDWVTKIGVVALPLQVHCAGRQWDVAQEIYKKMCDVITLNPNVELIILPESSCCFELNKYPEIIHFLGSCLRNGNGDSVAVILGAHRVAEQRLYNTLYYIQENDLYTYDKTHGLVGAERLPSWLTGLCGDRSLLVNGTTFAQGIAGQSNLSWQHRIFKPYICSEFFFTSHESAENILCIANDAWYAGTFLPNILFLTALFKATSARKEIIYVAHEYAYYAGRTSCINLKKR